MTGSSISRRFAESTRGRIAAQLRIDAMTVDEIPSRLGLTSNAVRAQVMALEADGIVHKAGALPTPSKPSVRYALTHRAESAYSQLYLPFLTHLLGVLDRRLPPGSSSL